VAQQTNWSEVEDIIQTAEQSGGVLGVTLRAPNGDQFTHNAERQFITASTVKIPIMVEIFREIEQGERSLDDRYVLNDADRCVGGGHSGVLGYLTKELEFRLYDLIYLMISISDNTATNVLIDMAGFDRVNATMQAIGMTNSMLGRKMLGRAAQGDEQENWGTPNDYAHLIQLLLNHAAASAASCDQMIAILEKQQTKGRIARYLPQGEDIRWGSKPGGVKGAHCDAGFITSSKGTLILSIFSERLPDAHISEDVIGRISRAAMQATGVVEPLYTS
jgi:beta-lactamase class A